jgi:ribosome biogenesis GTPase A
MKVLRILIILCGFHISCCFISSTRLFSCNRSIRKKLPLNAIANENLKSSPIIQWYPGHIAKGEKALMSCLKKVDVVVELRDARISTSTAHPLVEKWVGMLRPRIIVFAHLDQIPNEALTDWRKYLSYKVRGKIPMYWVDSKKGKGIHELRRAILAKGDYVNQRRVRRGIKPRAIRAAVIGFPNVGKSAIINQVNYSTHTTFFFFFKTMDTTLLLLLL